MVSPKEVIELRRRTRCRRSTRACWPRCSEIDGVEAAGGIFSARGLDHRRRTASRAAAMGRRASGSPSSPEPLRPAHLRRGRAARRRRRGGDRQGLGRRRGLRARRPGARSPARRPVEEYTLVGIATLGDVDSFGGATVAVLHAPGGAADHRQAGPARRDQRRRRRRAPRPSSSREPRRRAARTRRRSRPGAENVESQHEDVGEFVGFLKTALLIFAGVALFVAAFLIFNTFSITVAQRTREFAMLRTLGANRRQILGSVVLEAFAIGLGRLDPRAPRGDRVRAGHRRAVRGDRDRPARAPERDRGRGRSWSRS